jgi:hypothetical protein
MSVYVPHPRSRSSAKKCVVCGNTHLARGLCQFHYSRALIDGTLQNYPTTRIEQPPPVRPKFEYTNDAGEAELARAVEALDELKASLVVSRYLDAATKKLIVDAPSATTIELILKNAAPKKRFPFTAGEDGFLKYIGE